MQSRGLNGRSTTRAGAHEADVGGSRAAVDYLEASAEQSYIVDADALWLTAAVESDTLHAEEGPEDVVPELVSLRAALASLGEEGFSVTRIEARSQSGLLGTRVAGRYTLRLGCPRARISDCVRVVEEHGTLLGARWSFPERPDLHDDALRRAATRARERAEVVAAAIGVTLGTPHRVLLDAGSEELDGPPKLPSKKGRADGSYVTLAARRQVTVKITLRAGFEPGTD